MLGIAVLPKAKSAGDKNTWTYFYHTSSKQEGGSIPHARTRLRATPSPRGFTPKTPKNSATFAQQNVGKFAVRSVLPTVANDQRLPSGGFAGAQPRLAQNAAPARVLPAYSRRSLFPRIFTNKRLVALVANGNNRYRSLAVVLNELDVRARVFRKRVV